MIKGLYFKLEENNEKHKAIINFFDTAKASGKNKVDVLYDLIFQRDVDCYLDRLYKAGASCVKRSGGSK